jgi:Domain of unknown function (DUF4169)
MAADILSLSKARKTKQRHLKEKQAEENRVLFGRTKGQKQADESIRSKFAAVLDGAHLVKPDADQ